MGYSVLYRGLVAFFFLFSAGMLWFGVVTVLGDPTALTLVCLVFGTLALGMGWAAYDAFLVTVAFSEEGMFWDSPLSREGFVPWSSVASVDYSASLHWFTFRAPGFPTLRVSIYRDGLRTFAEHAARGLERSPAGRAPHLLFEKSGARAALPSAG